MTLAPIVADCTRLRTHDALALDGGSRPLTDARLAGLGTALPTHTLPRAESRDRLADLWRLDGVRRNWWERLVDGSRIERRHAVRPLETVIGLGTAERMAIFAIEAPPLATAAGVAALRDAGVDAGAVTDLIIVTCTGFAAPGVDVELVAALGLRSNVRRLQIGFMGCFGAISGLRAAAGACSADPAGIALVVCVELCTLHLRSDRSRENLVATALFGDGAAAAVVVGRSANATRDGNGGRPRPRIGLGRPSLLDGHRDAMTWTITDAGFAMTLAREVPSTLRGAIRNVATDAGIDVRRSRFAVHPGGAAIVEAVDAGLALAGGRGLEHAWATLADCGNVSSATILFVLRRLLATAEVEPSDEPIELFAFGPGLTVEHLLLSVDDA